MNAIRSAQYREHGWNDSKPSTYGGNLPMLVHRGPTDELDKWRAFGTVWAHARGLDDLDELADALGLGGQP